MKTDFFELPIGDLYQEEQTMKAKPVKLIDHQWVQVPKEEATHVAHMCYVSYRPSLYLLPFKNPLHPSAIIR